MALSKSDSGWGRNVSTTSLSNSAGVGCAAALGDVMLILATLESTAASYTTGSSISDTTANVYALRNRIEYTSSSTFGSGKVTMEIWWAYIAHAITGGTTITMTTGGGAIDNAVFLSVDITGFTGVAYETNPWDQSAATSIGFAATNTGSTQTQLTSGANVSTANAATLTFAFGGTGDNSVTVPLYSSYATGPIAGTTATDSGETCQHSDAGTNAALGAMEYRVLSSTISGASAAFGTGATAGGWGIMVDALSQTGPLVGGTTPYNPWPQQGPILAQRRKSRSIGWLPPRYERRRNSRLFLPNRNLIVPKKAA